MITIYDRTTGDEYSGKSVESIVRRVWGRKATVRLRSDPNERFYADVLGTPFNRGGGYPVLAVIIVSEEARKHWTMDIEQT